MPVVTLTDPELPDVPVVGACRFGAKSIAVWEEFVAGILKHASVIVVHVTERCEGLDREISIINEAGLMCRTVFVLGDLQQDTIDRADAINRGAKVLSSGIYGIPGLSELVSAIEEIKTGDIHQSDLYT
jgi:hypothetical protein